jgi:N-succinyldiaminopimelate aminotransferase
MTPGLSLLQAYPFEKLTQLKQGITPPFYKPHIAMSIGEPRHRAPLFIQEILQAQLTELNVYPTTKGLTELREAIAGWLSRRFQIPAERIEPNRHILPVNGTREALFSFAQCLIDPASKPVVVMPNPFYQIYEGAALLAGAEPYFLNIMEATGYLPNFDEVPVDVWKRCQLVYVCSPGNPSGAVMEIAEFKQLLELAERYDFVIASDECYSELYDDESNPPTGLLQAALAMGNSDFKRCVVFHSLSKRSNVPGLRSGFVAGDAAILQSYFHYRTYHGCAMPLPAQRASMAAWNDERHVIENRVLYREKFTDFMAIVGQDGAVRRPEGGFYVWLKTPIDDTDFARDLFTRENITVLPGSFLSRSFNGINPGAGHVRIALVATREDCREAAERIQYFLNH